MMKVLNTPFRSSHWRCSFYFSSFAGKRLCWSLFLIISLSVFCKEMFWKIHREIHVSRSLCRSLSFIKKRARHRFFPVTFAKLLWKLLCRTPLVAAFDLPTHFFKCVSFPKSQKASGCIVYLMRSQSAIKSSKKTIHFSLDLSTNLLLGLNCNFNWN